MGVLKEIEGDITFDYRNNNKCLILVVANCTSVLHKEGSFSNKIKYAFPYGDPYSRRIPGVYKNLSTIETRDKLSSVYISHCPSDDNPSIACLYTQYKMGSANSSYFVQGTYTDKDYVDLAFNRDTQEHRLKYFSCCLKYISSLLNNKEINKKIEEVVLPKYLGCGSGGGRWEDYSAQIAVFARELNNVNVTIVNYSLVEAIFKRIRTTSLFGIDKCQKNTLSQDTDIWNVGYNVGKKRKADSGEEEKLIRKEEGFHSKVNKEDVNRKVSGANKRKKGITTKVLID